jgi:bifunctional ADP-heptose synthase (sugar kinase/adenylyltransferase)
LKCVDAVFVKDTEPTSEGHINLYRTFLPDIITIGNEYPVEDRIGYDSAQAGATLIKVDTWQEPKTSSIIDKIIEKYSQFYPN